MRAALNGFAERHEVAWELAMEALAVAYVVVGFAAEESTALQPGALQYLDVALTGVFVAEFAVRIGASFERGRYLREHWVDLMALVPAVRQFRLLRLLRLLRLVRTFAGHP